MKLTAPLSGGHFGSLGVYIRGLVTYRLSPFEQKAFPGMKSFPRLIQRLTGNLVFTVPPFVIGYLIYTSTEKKFAQMCRKNPADYENDK